MGQLYSCTVVKWHKYSHILLSLSLDDRKPPKFRLVCGAKVLASLGQSRRPLGLAVRLPFDPWTTKTSSSDCSMFYTPYLWSGQSTPFDKDPSSYPESLWKCWLNELRSPLFWVRFVRQLILYFKTEPRVSNRRLDEIISYISQYFITAHFTLYRSH